MNNKPTSPNLTKDEIIALIKTTPTQAYFKEYITGGFWTRVIFKRAVLFVGFCDDQRVEFLMSEADFKHTYKSEHEINATLLIKHLFCWYNTTTHKIQYAHPSK